MYFDQLDWQTIVALGIVFVALGILARKTWRIFFDSATGCGTSCDGCASANPVNSRNKIKVTELIQIDSTAQADAGR